MSGRSSVEIDVDARSLGRWGAVISESSQAAAHKCLSKEIWPLGHDAKPWTCVRCAEGNRRMGRMAVSHPASFGNMIQKYCLIEKRNVTH